MQFATVVSILSLVSQCYGTPVPPPLSESELQLGQTYFNYTAGLLDTLDKAEAESEAEPKPNTDRPSIGIYAGSSFGLGYLMAVINEKFVPVSVPIFEKYLASVPKTLPDSYDFILSQLTKDSDITVSNTLFTADKVSLTPGLNKLKLKVVDMDFKSAEAPTTINSVLAKELGKSLEEPYIPQGSVLSPSTKAILVNTFRVSEDWPVPTTQAPNQFNGKNAELIELQGPFKVFESKQGVEVIIPFKNDKRAISLLLPNESYNGPPDQPQLVNASSVRVQIPAFEVTIRALSSNNPSAQCDFKKEENIFQLLDGLTHVSLNHEKFEAISVSGAEINGVDGLKQELSSKSKGRAIDSSSGTANSVTPAPSGTGNGGTLASERLVVFNRRFSWTLLDVNLGPLFTGTLESLESLGQKPTPAQVPAGSIFGAIEGSYLAKCL